MHDVFISYSRLDADIALSIARKLGSLGFHVWIDNRIGAGTSWEAALTSALDSSACVLLLASAHTGQSRWVGIETQAALAAGKLIPARIDDAPVPKELATLQFHDLRDFSRTGGDRELHRLAATLQDFILTRRGRAIEKVHLETKVRGELPAAAPHRGWSGTPAKAAAAGGAAALVAAGSLLAVSIERGGVAAVRSGFVRSIARAIGMESETAVAAAGARLEARAGARAAGGARVAGRSAVIAGESSVPQRVVYRPFQPEAALAENPFSIAAMRQSRTFERFLFDLNPARASYKATLDVADSGAFTISVERLRVAYLNERSRTIATFAFGSGTGVAGVVFSQRSNTLLAIGDDGLLAQLLPSGDELIVVERALCGEARCDVRELLQGADNSVFVTTATGHVLEVFVETLHANWYSIDPSDMHEGRVSGEALRLTPVTAFASPARTLTRDANGVWDWRR